MLLRFKLNRQTASRARFRASIGLWSTNAMLQSMIRDPRLPQRRPMRLLNRAYLGMALPFFEPRSFQGATSRFRKYEQLEKLPLAENKNRQWESLRRLLLYSYQNSPFY